MYNNQIDFVGLTNKNKSTTADLTISEIIRILLRSKESATTPIKMSAIE